MSFSSEIKERVLVACSRHCCICHQFCGPKIELHHIVLKSEGGEDTFENCIPLCFNCHADQSSYDHRHPKGTKYTSSELKLHRDNWFERNSKTIFRASDEKLIELDKETLSKIKNLLPWDGIISFLRSHHFGAQFPGNRIEELHEFERYKFDPCFEFFDAELEPLRASLKAAINNFLENIMRETFSDENYVEMRGIPREWRNVDPLRFDEIAECLNQSANRVVDEYDRLIKAGRRKLGNP